MTDKPAAPSPHKPISRQNAKRLRALHTAEINRMTDGRDRELTQMAEEIQKLRQQLTNACAVLEAVVRRHGQQSFDRQTIQSVCARGHVQFDVTVDRITVRLRDVPAAADIVSDS